MNYKQYRQQLDEIFGGRGTVYHLTNIWSAEEINKQRAFLIRDPIEEPNDDIWDEIDEDEYEELEFAPFISFTRSRGTHYTSNLTPNEPTIVYEFNKNELTRNSRGEAQKITWEPYDFFEVRGSDSRLGSRGKKAVYTSHYADEGRVTTRSQGQHEMEERMWFIEPNDWMSRGVYRSINKVHVVFKGNLEDMSASELEDLLDKVEVRGTDTLFYRTPRDFVQNKAFFDPFEFVS